jgi:hypothetical protein
MCYINCVVVVLLETARDRDDDAGRESQRILKAAPEEEKMNENVRLENTRFNDDNKNYNDFA